jgi:(R)-2-hydroxyglutarate---pyruvate transhydrogenase
MELKSPQSTNNLLLALPSFDNLLPLFRATKTHLSEILSAFEYFDRTAYDLAVKHGQGKAMEESEIEGAQCFVLIETSGGRKEHDEEVSLDISICVDARTDEPIQKLNGFLEHLMEGSSSLIQTGVLSQSPAQFASMWGLREGIPEAVSKEGKAYKYDISIPVFAFKDVVDRVNGRLQEKGLLGNGVKCAIGYGHIGDGEFGRG